MIFKKIAIILFTVLIYQCAIAQSIGYQGKRLSIGFQVSGAPLLGTPIAGDDILDLNLHYAAGFEYAISKKYSVGLQIGWHEDIIKIRSTGGLNLIPRPEGYSSSAYYSLFSTITDANYSYRSASGILKIFNQRFGSLAPIGQYFQFGYEFGNVLVHDDGRYYSSSQTRIYSNYLHNFSIGTGIQNVYFDQLILDLSLALALNPTGIKAMIVRGNGKGYTTFHPVHRKAFSNHFFRTQIKLSWLLF